MKRSLLVPAIALAITAPLLAPRDARACGGCYHRPSETETTVVTGHRMVLSVSTTQTVLWDQIEYDGDPTEFAWVLPVKPGARIELATDAWFEALDAATSVNIVSPPLDCAPAPGARSGGGCGSVSESFAGGDEGGFFPNSSVTVVHRGTVGPYETVTLSTDTPGALNTWLTEHEYAVDADVQPIIDAYVAEGFDFIALRLQPGQGVRAMKPVRVVTPGASPTLPLRMVAAGTGPFVGIKLFVITEGRFVTKNFPSATISRSDVTWDHLTTSSNYTPLRDAALATNDGRTWITTYAKQRALLSPVQNPTSFGNVAYSTGEGLPVETIAEAYMLQAVKNGETTSGLCGTAFTQHAESASVVTDPCPPDAQDPSACPSVPAGNLDARDFACGEADDLATAMTGLHPRDVWITRLESFLPRAALATDLELEASTNQVTVENWITPQEVLNETEACRQGLEGQSMPLVPGARDGRPPRITAFVLLTGLLGLLAAARRLRRPEGAVG